MNAEISVRCARRGRSGEIQLHFGFEWLADCFAKISIREEGSSDSVASWTADDWLSDLALLKLAAATREVETWSRHPLPMKGREWGRYGAPPTLVFSIDFGQIVLAATARNRLRLSFHVAKSNGIYRAFDYTVRFDESRRFGVELTALLPRLTFV